jgi:hypothetical protein
LPLLFVVLFRSLACELQLRNHSLWDLLAFSNSFTNGVQLRRAIDFLQLCSKSTPCASTNRTPESSRTTRLLSETSEVTTRSNSPLEGSVTSPSTRRITSPLAESLIEILSKNRRLRGLQCNRAARIRVKRGLRSDSEHKERTHEPGSVSLASHGLSRPATAPGGGVPHHLAEPSERIMLQDVRPRD